MVNGQMSIFTIDHSSFTDMKHPFDALNNYFDGIYLLTLPSLQHREDAVMKRLEGLNVRIHYGIDKQLTSMAVLKESGLYNLEQYRRYYKKPAEMPLGMLCCALGHVGIYHSIIVNKHTRTLILEDDVVPLIESIKYFPQIADELPDDWELLYLGYEKNEQYGWKQRLKQWVYRAWPNHAQMHLTSNMYKNFYPRTVSPHIAHAGFHDCTHAYAVTLRGAEKLLYMQQPVRFNPDNALAWASSTEKVNAYIRRPKLFNQLSAFTDQIPSLTGD
jgi:glycosyl transferase family 25